MKDKNTLKAINQIASKQIRKDCERKICDTLGWKKSTLDKCKSAGLPARYAYSPTLRYMIQGFVDLDIKGGVK